MAHNASADRPKIAAAKPRFPEEDLAEVLPKIESILKSGRLILEQHTAQFEEAFSTYVGTEHAVAVSTCTAALQIALRFHQVRGREVILPTNNFIGVVSAILYEGGIPVLVDMDPETFCMDLEDALARIMPRTAGIIAVHIAGRIDPGIDRLKAVCDERGLFLIVLGTCQLKRLDENVAHRNRMVGLYRHRLQNEDWLTIPSHSRDELHAYYKFPVLLRADVDRDRFRRMLWTDFAIENGGIYDPPCHLQPVLRQMFGFGEGMFPKAEATLKRQICPPIHSAISREDVDTVADAMIAVARHCGRG